MKEKIVILKSEIESDRRKLERLFVKFERSYNGFLKTKEYSKLVESAFYVSQIYTGFENMFKNIAKTFENNIEEDKWHKSLLERMALEIEDIRPALLSDESFDCLNELMAFRHFFRHAYEMEIDKEKFKIVASKVSVVKDLFKREIEKFLGFLRKLTK